MLLNYLKLSFRLLARSPFLTFINVAGLSVGFAVFFILWPFTQSELKSDQFIKDYKHIARAVLDWSWTDNGVNWDNHLNVSWGFSYLANEMKGHAAIQSTTRFIPRQWFDQQGTPGLQKELVLSLEKAGEQTTRLRIESAICADKNFFEFFSLPFKFGNAATTLEQVDAIAIAKDMARTLFGNMDPTGETLKINNKVFLVTGVFESVPNNSHLEFDFVFSNESKLSFWNTPNDHIAYQYFKLNGDPVQLADILNRNKERLYGYFLDKNPHIKINFVSQPLDEIARSRYTDDFFRPKSKFMLKTLAAVSLVVILIAWMNYVNLTFSKTRTRFKEIAARKVSGATFSNLLVQFICQSALINTLAVCVGLTLIQIVRIPFSQLFNIYVVTPTEFDPQTLFFFVALFTCGIIATAIYPAWLTLRQTTRQLLSNSAPVNKRITTTLFTTAQYVAALSLIAWSLVMSDQISFIIKKDLGIQKDDMIVVDSPILGLEHDGLQKITQFAGSLNTILGDSAITLSAQVCGEAPGEGALRRVGSEVFYGIDSQGGVDENFIPVYGIKLIAGRNFVKDENDKSIILSRLAVTRLGFKSPEDAVGAVIEEEVEGQWTSLDIIGVMEDYRVTPFLTVEGSTESATGRGQFLTYLNSVYTEALPKRISLRLEGKEPAGIIPEIKKRFDEMFPGNLFKWYFLDEWVKHQYADQEIARNQLTLFTVLAVGVACLGLLGMVSNKVVEKIKEISVRRILGARHCDIISLLLSSTGAQIVIALLIGLPVAWQFSHTYLQKYTDHIELQWWHFIAPALILILIMVATVAGVVWRAARLNPVDALKHE
jgi:putative ABC transport system permease protein